MLQLLQEPSDQHSKVDCAEKSSSIYNAVACPMGQIPCLPAAKVSVMFNVEKYEKRAKAVLIKQRSS